MFMHYKSLVVLLFLLLRLKSKLALLTSVRLEEGDWQNGKPVESLFFAR